MPMPDTIAGSTIPGRDTPARATRLVRRSIGCLGALLLAAPWSAAGGKIADSVLQFSGTQGHDRWYYGYALDDLDGYQPDEFTPFTNYVVDGNGVGSWWLGAFNAAPWISLFADRMHGGVSPVRSTIRRWVSDRDGVVRIAGQVAKHLDGLGGDGVRASILIDGMLVYEQIVAPADADGFDFSLDAGVFTGSKVDLLLHPLANSNLDTTRLIATIEDLTEVGPKYGTGCPGSGGFVPTLDVAGVPDAGGWMDLRLDQALGGSIALIIIGIDRASLPIGYGCHQFVAPLLPATAGPVALTGSGPGAGKYKNRVKLPKNTKDFPGVTLQAIVYDPAVPAGAAYTNGWELTFKAGSPGDGKKGKKGKKDKKKDKQD